MAHSLSIVPELQYPIAEFDDSNGTLKFYMSYESVASDDRKWNVEQLGYSLEKPTPWYEFRQKIKHVIIDVSFGDFSSLSTAYWFYDCNMLEDIEGMENLKTERAISMTYMFAGCKKLQSIDVSDFITSNVTNMSNMFYECSSLHHIDVSCFNTNKVTKMNGMFENCINLEELDLSSFDTHNVKEIKGMFNDCHNLKKIYVSDEWNIENAKTYIIIGGKKALFPTVLFKNCYSLVGEKGTAYNPNIVDLYYARVDKGEETPGYLSSFGVDLSGFDISSTQAYANLSGNTLTFYYDDKAASRLGTLFPVEFNSGYMQMPSWYGVRSRVNTVVFDESFAAYHPTSTSCWFYNCSNLQSIEGIENLNTEDVTSMNAMFRFCGSLRSIDVTHFNTCNVVDMAFMFCYCSSLTDLDVSNFVTDKVQDMQHMFHTCKVKKLDLANFNTKEVKFMDIMFSGCSNLEKILAGTQWTTDNAYSGACMFSGCSSLVGGCGTKYSSANIGLQYAHIDEGVNNPGYLTGPPPDPTAYTVLKDGVLTFFYDSQMGYREGEVSIIESNYTAGHMPRLSGEVTKAVIDTSFVNYHPTSTAFWFYGNYKMTQIEAIENLCTENVKDMSCMFYSCNSLTSIDVSKFNTQNVKDMAWMFYGCSSLTSIDVSNFDTQNVTNMSYMFSHCSMLDSLDVSNFNTQNVTNMNSMFSGCSSLTSLDVSNFDTQNVTDMYYMFHYCSSLTSLDVSNFNTQNVTCMNSMFYGCSRLTFLDLSNFNTQNVADMGSMFYNCCNLTSLDISNFNTKNVRSMNSMFSGCSRLPSLDLSNFNTQKVTSMGEMFYDCSSLIYLDVSSFDTENTTDMGCMFYGCRSLTSLDLSNFNTQNVTDMIRMFSGCSSLTSLDLSNFNTQNVKNMSCLRIGMFYNCSSLTSLDLSNFNTQNVTDLSYMFYNCNSLTSLDVSNFDTQNVTDMYYMFYNCSSLEKIFAGEGWSTENVTYGYNMFYGCNKLIGEKDTQYSNKNIDYTYARIDGGADAPGYFTFKSSVLRGDANGDGKVDMDDATFVTNIILGIETATEAADVNKDEEINMPDVMFIINYIKNGKFPDE